MKEKKSTFGWIFSFAGQKKSGYIASVILAVIGAAFQILPFFVMAQVIGKLLAGNKDLAGYLIDCAVMAAFWLLRVLFHSLSTAQSHKATFAVLGNIRKQGLAKLAKMPLGDVQAKHPRRAGGQHRTDAGARHSGDEQQCRSRLGNLDLSLCHRLAYGACFTHYFSARYGVLYADDGRIREELRPNRCGHQHPERYSGGIHRRHRGHQGVRKSKKQL